MIILRFLIFPTSSIPKTVSDPAFPGSMVPRMTCYPTLPRSGVVRMAGDPIFPGWEVLKMIWDAIFSRSNDFSFNMSNFADTWSGSFSNISKFRSHQNAPFSDSLGLTTKKFTAAGSILRIHHRLPIDPTINITDWKLCRWMIQRQMKFASNAYLKIQWHFMWPQWQKIGHAQRQRHRDGLKRRGRARAQSWVRAGTDMIPDGSGRGRARPRNRPGTETDTDGNGLVGGGLWTWPRAWTDPDAGTGTCANTDRLIDGIRTDRLSTTIDNSALDDLRVYDQRCYDLRCTILRFTILRFTTLWFTIYD